MKVNLRIQNLVKLAISTKPDIFKTITANKGPNKETGYSIFYNKGTGYDYSLISFMDGIFICFKITDAVTKSSTKYKKANDYLEKFNIVFKDHTILDMPKRHEISTKPYHE